MNSQTTPIHLRLWNRDFWLLAMADLLISMSVTMWLPVLPQWLSDTARFSAVEVGLSMGVFGLGLYVLGWFCSWLVQRYRRNMVCMWAIAAQAVSLLMLWYADTLGAGGIDLWLVVVQRTALGATYGLAQMVLSSTLIIDTCESAQRTEANHSAAWFRRFALSLGPLAGMLAFDQWGVRMVVWGAVGCNALALLLLMAARFPFRAPEEGVSIVSTDRFLLMRGCPLFLNLLIPSVVIGLIVTLPLTARFYAAMMGGFLLALLAQRFVFREAELKSEVVSGLILLGAALLDYWVLPGSPLIPLFVGLSTGIVGSRFLLFFIKLSRHCQRGTSQSMYFLGWESGLAIGLGLGYGVFQGQTAPLLYTGMALTVAALLLYHFYTHSWFLRNKNR